MDTNEGNAPIEATPEFLNVQKNPGAPPHTLRLVIGALYEIMRNFSPSDRLMNHTTVILSEVYNNHVVIRTLDNRTFPLPRICFLWALSKGTTTMLRRQYPLRPAYASTYNGSQGTTLLRAVVEVRQSPFAHGPLYAALGRVHGRADVRVLTTDERRAPSGRALTKNVVWKELLLRSSDYPLTARVSKRPAKRQ